MTTTITLAAVNISSIRRSVGIQPDSELGKILTTITQKIKEKFLDFEGPFKITQNGQTYIHHVELVDEETDINNKVANYKKINGLSIDLNKKENWVKEGRAIVLKLGNFPGHMFPVHITVGFNKNGFTEETLEQIKALILELVKQN